LEKGNAVLERQLESKDDDVKDFFRKASQDMLVYQEALDNALKETQAECDKKVADMASQLEQKEAEKKALAAEYEAKLVKQAQDDELLRQKLQAEDQLRYAQLLASSKAKETQLSQEKQNLNEKLEKLSETNSCLQGEVKLATYHQGKLPVSQLTSQAQFDELEAEKAAFDRFYKKAWKAAKKQIRSDVMNETLTQGIDKKKKRQERTAEVTMKKQVLSHRRPSFVAWLLVFLMAAIGAITLTLLLVAVTKNYQVGTSGQTLFTTDPLALLMLFLLGVIAILSFLLLVYQTAFGANVKRKYRYLYLDSLDKGKLNDETTPLFTSRAPSQNPSPATSVKSPKTAEAHRFPTLSAIDDAHPSFG
jgi:chemotaxis protein histidine kinase CheA